MTIPTIRREKWHRAKDRWQAVDSDGWACSFIKRPDSIPCLHGGGYWVLNQKDCSWMRAGPKRTPPRDYTTTLRRIRPATKGTK